MRRVSTSLCLIGCWYGRCIIPHTPPHKRARLERQPHPDAFIRILRRRPCRSRRAGAWLTIARGRARAPIEPSPFHEPAVWTRSAEASPACVYLPADHAANRPSRTLFMLPLLQRQSILRYHSRAIVRLWRALATRTDVKRSSRTAGAICAGLIDCLE